MAPTTYIRAGPPVALLLFGTAFGCFEHPPSPAPTAAGQQGWGSLRGRFVYGGSLPPAPELAGDTRTSVCEWHVVPDEALVIHPETGGIKNVVVFARRVGRIRERDEATGGRPTLGLERCAFVPHVQVVRVRQPLRVVNRDPLPHIFLIRPPLEPETNLLLLPGGESEVRFSRAQPAPVPVTCSLHPWMRAYVLVRGEPYVAVSDADGFFALADLPAGEEIEFQVWHEQARGPRGGLVARPEWPEGRFRVTIPHGGVLDLGEVRVPPAAFGGR